MHSTRLRTAFQRRLPSKITTRIPVAQRLAAMAMALLLIPQADLVAQQMSPYGSQYAPAVQYTPQSDYEQPNYTPQSGYSPQSGYGYQQSQGLVPAQLEQLVAPIALNPDPLVALMLAASTYPQQVTEADHWRQAQGNAPPDQIAYGADQQNWDPSVKALTAFPQVLAEMDQNIQWTAALGNAYYNQPQDILQAIQIMRQRAQSAGNLQSTPQENVSYNQGYIQLTPPNPQVIYVPSYNPWTVYGQPVSPYPGFSLLGALGSFFNSSFGSSAIQYGLGIVMSAFSHTPWGLLSWGLNWLTQNLLFHQSSYYSSSPYVADWGLRYGGPRAYMAPHRSLAAYNRGYSSAYNRGYGQNLVRTQNNYGRYQTSANNYNRASYALNGRSGYNTGIYNRAQSPFANHSTYGYQNNYRGYQNNYHAPSQSFARNDYAQRTNTYSGNAYRGNGFVNSSRSPEFSSPSFHSGSNSGGFHLFGGNHSSNKSGSFGKESSFKAESFKAPKYKAPKAPKGYGGGGHHSFGGGHSSSHGGGHHH